MNKIPIVILHGWNLDSRRFTPLVNLLRKNASVYCPDLPGFGKTKKPAEPLMLNDYLNFLVIFLKRKKIAKVNLICHSFGGRIGIKFSALYPSYINSLVLSGVPGIPPVPKIKMLFFLYLAKLGKIIFTLPPFSYYRNFAQKLIYRASNSMDFYNTVPSMRETFQNVVSENLDKYLGKISIPTLLLWGEKDTIVPVKIANILSSKIKGSKLVIVKDVAHGFPYTHAALFADNLKNFI